MKCSSQNKNREGEPAREIGYFADLRPFWKKLIEFPFRLMGIIRYDPLTEIPMCEMVFNKK